MYFKVDPPLFTVQYLHLKLSMKVSGLRPVRLTIFYAISRFSRKSIEDLFTIGKRWTNPNFEGID